MASKRVIFLIVFLIVTSSLTSAALITAGTGTNSAEVYIEWSDGFVAEFEVSFGSLPTDTVTGADLLFTLDGDLVDFSLTYGNFGTEEEPSYFVDGIDYLSHTNLGFGGDENWWHYWTKDATETEWTASIVGMSDRVVSNGDSDGWIYGRASAVPEPTTIALLAMGSFMMNRKKRI